MNNDPSETSNSGNQKRGRPQGGKNKAGHNAGRKRHQIADQSVFDSFITRPTSLQVK